MLYVGLSGGIGSGKSTVSARLAELGAVIIDADLLAREVVAPGSDGLADITSRFGAGVIQPDGSLDRPALGAIVFADESARRDLEAITHPRVQQLTERRRRGAQRDAIVVHDVPLLVEVGLAPDHHLAVIVDATVQVRRDRLVRDRGMDPDAAVARINAQATDEQRYAVADALLDNNGTREALLDQVETLWRERLSPYNDNLLADRVVERGCRGAVPGAERSLQVARSIARIERQLTMAGLISRVNIEPRDVTAVASLDVIDLELRVDDAGLLGGSEIGTALHAAGFGQGRPAHDPASGQAPLPEWIFDGFDPAVVARLRAHQAPIR